MMTIQELALLSAIEDQLDHIARRLTMIEQLLLRDHMPIIGKRYKEPEYE